MQPAGRVVIAEHLALTADHLAAMLPGLAKHQEVASRQKQIQDFREINQVEEAVTAVAVVTAVVVAVMMVVVMAENQSQTMVVIVIDLEDAVVVTSKKVVADLKELTAGMTATTIESRYNFLSTDQ